MSSQNIADTANSDQSKTERVYDYLRGRIRDLTIPPGARLHKNKIGMACGVSRAPVSDAIARLAGEGLVDVFPQSGSFVAPLRVEDVREAMFMRRALEVEAVKQATREADKDLLEQLEKNLEEQRRALNARKFNPARMDDLDEMFHTLIISSLHSPRVQQVLRMARAIMDRPRFQALPEHDRPHETLVEHQRIVDAICTGDPGLAASAMRVHICAVSDAIEEKLALIAEQEND
jgi:DNA-binding GntR family transcriptional regulator